MLINNKNKKEVQRVIVAPLFNKDCYGIKS